MLGNPVVIIYVGRIEYSHDGKKHKKKNWNYNWYGKQSERNYDNGIGYAKLNHRKYRFLNQSIKNRNPR